MYGHVLEDIFDKLVIKYTFSVKRKEFELNLNRIKFLLREFTLEK